MDDRRLLRFVGGLRRHAMPPLREMLGRQSWPSSSAGVGFPIHVDVLVSVGGLKATQNCHGLVTLRLSQVIHRRDGRELE